MHACSGVSSHACRLNHGPCAKPRGELLPNATFAHRLATCVGVLAYYILCFILCFIPRELLGGNAGGTVLYATPPYRGVGGTCTSCTLMGEYQTPQRATATRPR